MAKTDWLRQIKSGESLTVEFKRQIPKLERLARTLSAFSNSTGGTLFIGIDDMGDPVGVENLSGSRELVEEVCQFHITPEVEPTFHEWTVFGRQVLVVVVSEAHNKPIYAVSPKNPKDAWPFFRSDKENLPLDRKSLKAMRHAPESTEIDEEELAKLDRHALLMLNNLHRKPRQTLNALAKGANISHHRAKKIIVQLEQNGWIHGHFNEKRREYSLVVDWKIR